MSKEDKSHQTMKSGCGEGEKATVIKPEYGTETHGSPASQEGVREDEGKQ